MLNSEMKKAVVAMILDLPTPPGAEINFESPRT